MPAFYSDPIYKLKQSEITKSNWKKGIYASRVTLLQIKICKFCNKSFEVKPYDPKIFCSQSFAASFNNMGKIQPELTKKKIALSLLGNKSPFYGMKK